MTFKGREMVRKGRQRRASWCPPLPARDSELTGVVHLHDLPGRGRLGMRQV